MDGKGEFTAMQSEPMGGKPTLAPARPDGGAQTGQVSKSGTEGLLGRIEGAIERNI